MLRPHAISTAFPYTTLFVEQERNRGEAEPFERFWRAEGVDRVVIRRLHSAAGGVPVIAHMMKREQGAAPRYPCLYPWERILLNPKEIGRASCREGVQRV